MIKKILNLSLFFFLTIFFTSSFFITEARLLNIKTSDSIYIFLDLRDPSKLSIELSLINKINLKGECIIKNKSLEMKTSIKDLDLTHLSKYTPLPITGYIKKGNLDIKINKSVSLEGELQANELKFTNKNEGKRALC